MGMRELFSLVANEKHYDVQIRHMERKKSFRTINRKYGWTFSHFIHGKFGFDTLFLFFGIFGIALIPYYFWNKMQVRRKIMKLNDIDPSIIENLDEDSEIDIDDVSYHTTFVDMSELKKERKIEREKKEVVNTLIKDVY